MKVFSRSHGLRDPGEMGAADRVAGHVRVEVPDAIAAKFPKAAANWAGHWIFSSPTLAVRRRQCLFAQRLQRASKLAVARAAGSRSNRPRRARVG